ncbi:uncharacterized protein LOC107043514 isoform X2 [Diachasma alloeum]|uniref:uncharacterized protein LOC107043514 isoform X2 n=1 Tax=Diachasma alloeum TaxID=454923 RepID=UPI000738441F|nr:uncharacterized protein LOC107043514 isoform X2 [Diachasma alloeum]
MGQFVRKVLHKEEDDEGELEEYLEGRPREQPNEGLQEHYEGDSEDPRDEGGPHEEYAEEEEDDEEDDEGENEKSFNKNRAPIRKSPSLIQYWLDTGKAPYPTKEDPSILHELILTNNPDSSLSEENCPKLETYPITTNTISMQRPEGASNSTSVATGPYIRSTNITNRSEMLVIMEGSRSPEEPLDPGDPLDPEETRETRDPLEQSRLNTPAHQETEEICDNNNVSLDKSLETSMILSKLEETVEKSLNRSRLTSCDGSDSEVMNLMAPSMKISDVLEDLGEHIDKFTSKATIHGLRKESDVGSGESSGRGTPRLPPLMKKGNRRKLWTGRNSPMDIIVSSTMDSEDQIVPKTGNLHPALQGTPEVKMTVPSVKRRTTMNARRQSKKFLNHEHSRNSKDSSDPPSERREKKFLKNLGLVPSPRFNTKTKRKIIGGVAKRKSLRRRQKRKVQYREVDSDTDEDESSGSSVKSSVADETENLLSLCTKKILTVPLERLSETLLGRTGGKSGGEKHRRLGGNSKNGRVNESSSTSRGSPETEVFLSRNMRSVPQTGKIELDSQESDQSTIIMMECEENREQPSNPPTRSKRSASESEIPLGAAETDESTPGDERAQKKIPSVLRRSKKSVINSQKAQGAVETDELTQGDEREEKKIPSVLLRRSKKSVINSQKAQGTAETDESTQGDEREEKKIPSVLLRRSKKLDIESEKAQGATETDESTQRDERGEKKIPSVLLRRSKKSVINSEKAQGATETDESTPGDERGEKKNSPVLLRRSKKSVINSQKAQGATETDESRPGDERGEKKIRSALLRRPKKSGIDSEKTQGATETDESRPGDERVEKKIPSVLLRRSKKLDIDSENTQGATETDASTPGDERGEKKIRAELLGRSKKSGINSQKAQGAAETDESKPGDERMEKKIPSVLLRRSKKSVVDPEKAQDEREEANTVPRRRGRPKKLSSQSGTLQASSEAEKTSPKSKSSSLYPTRSRRPLSDSDKPSGVINNRDLTREEEKFEKKLDNRAIRRMRQRSALRKAKNEQKKRKSRKVNSKKVKVKPSNDKSELLDGINASMRESPAPGDGQESDEGDEGEDREESEEEGRTVIRATVTIDSDSYSESSRDMKPRRTMNGIRRRCLEPVIKFFSDDDNDFITKMEMSYHRAQRRSMRRRTAEDELSEDQKRIIDDLTSETVPIFSGSILPSDEEEIYESSRVKDKKMSARTTKNMRSGSGKSAGAVESPGKSIKNTTRPSFIRVLSYDDASSKQSEEVQESPPKRFKTETGVINKRVSSDVGRSVDKNKSLKGVESDSSGSSSGSMVLLLGRRTRSCGIKRKAEFEEDDVQGRSPSDDRNSSVRSSQSPIKQTRTLTPVVKLLRVSSVDRLASPVKLPTKKPQAVIKCSDKRLPSPKEKLPGVKLMDLSVSIAKIPDDLERSLKKDDRKSSSVVSPVKSINHSRKLIFSVRKGTRNSRKRALTSEDESSVDFCLENPTDSHDNLIDDESSDIDSIKCTKLFHNPFEDSGDGLTIPMNKNYERSRSSKNINNNLRKKSVITLRTRDDSDSDD